MNFPTLCDFGGERKVALGRGMKHKIIWACKDKNFISIANTMTRFEMVRMDQKIRFEESLVCRWVFSLALTKVT
jgi:hypothetical protein